MEKVPRPLQKSTKGASRTASGLGCILSGDSELAARMKPEESLHRAVAAFLDIALPEHAPYTTIGHGGGGKARGSKLKAMGLKPGWPDILILFTGRPILVELKSDKGYLSAAQKAVHTRLILSGAVVATCRSVEGVEDFLRVCGIPLNATVKARAAA